MKSRTSVTKVIKVPGDVALQGTYLNDIRFSPDGKAGYVTDSGTRGAIIVVDLESLARAFRALDGHVVDASRQDSHGYRLTESPWFGPTAASLPLRRTASRSRTMARRFFIRR